MSGGGRGKLSPSISSDEEGLLLNDNDDVASWGHTEVAERFGKLNLSRDFTKEIREHNLNGAGLLVLAGYAAQGDNAWLGSELRDLGLTAVGDRALVKAFLSAVAADTPPSGLNLGRAQARPKPSSSFVKMQRISDGSSFSIGSTAHYMNPLVAHFQEETEFSDKNPGLADEEPLGGSEIENAANPCWSKWVYPSWLRFRWQLGILAVVLLSAFWFVAFYRLYHYARNYHAFGALAWSPQNLATVVVPYLQYHACLPDAHAANRKAKRAVLLASVLQLLLVFLLWFGYDKWPSHMPLVYALHYIVLSIRFLLPLFLAFIYRKDLLGMVGSNGFLSPKVLPLCVLHFLLTFSQHPLSGWEEWVEWPCVTCGSIIALQLFVFDTREQARIGAVEFQRKYQGLYMFMLFTYGYGSNLLSNFQYLFNEMTRHFCGETTNDCPTANVLGFLTSFTFLITFVYIGIRIAIGRVIPSNLQALFLLPVMFAQDFFLEVSCQAQALSYFQPPK
jgi:hypothetical protein